MTNTRTARKSTPVTDERHIAFHDVFEEAPPILARLQVLLGTNDDGIIIQAAHFQIVIENVRGQLLVHVWDGDEALEGDACDTIVVENVRS